MNDFQTLDIDLLEFDKDNPRLPTSVRGDDEARILIYLATKTALENLMSSIGENSFFSGEAIVVIHADCGKYTVIEGNRRLAALRLLQNPTLVNVPGIERAAQEASHKPTEIPAYVVDSRDATLQYLGFRHISGVQRWDPLAKARYLESLFERTEGEASRRYTSVAREIGSTSTTVRRNLDALAAYRIIEQNGFYDVSEIAEETFQFGTFYTAISNVDVSNFVGTKDSGTPTHPITTPTVVIEENLEELVRFMFERDAQGNTKLGESRNIGTLGKVLDNPESLKALRMGHSLQTAYRLTPHGRDDFVRHVNQAIEELKQANANLHAVAHDDEVAKRAVREALRIIELASHTLGVGSNARYDLEFSYRQGSAYASGRDRTLGRLC